MASIPALAGADASHVLCRVDDYRFAVPVAAVAEVFRAVAVSPLPGRPDPVIGAVDVRGEFVPVMSARRRLGLPDRPVRPSDAMVQVVVRGHPVLVLVDAVVDTVRLDEAAVAPAGRVIPGAQTTDGVTTDVVGPLVVHDVDAFLTGAELVDVRAALAGAGDTRPGTP